MCSRPLGLITYRYITPVYSIESNRNEFEGMMGMLFNCWKTGLRPGCIEAMMH